MLVVRWEGEMVLVVQVIVGVWAAWVGWGRGEVGPNWGSLKVSRKN